MQLHIHLLTDHTPLQDIGRCSTSKPSLYAGLHFCKTLPCKDLYRLARRKTENEAYIFCAVSLSMPRHGGPAGPIATGIEGPVCYNQLTVPPAAWLRTGIKLRHISVNPTLEGCSDRNTIVRWSLLNRAPDLWAREVATFPQGGRLWRLPSCTSQNAAWESHRENDWQKLETGKRLARIDTYPYINMTVVDRFDLSVGT